MYFLKNSRCVLRKSQWFSSNIIERNFKISLRKSRGRWPKDDPTKPPLRLNIPKDTPVPGPYNFTPQIQLNAAQVNINSEKLAAHWLTPDVRLGNSEQDGVLRRSKSIVALEENRNSSEISDNINFTGKSKSSESLELKCNMDEVRNHPSEKIKNFKLKKTQSCDVLEPKTEDDISKEVKTEGKRGILTIKIALRENDKLVTGMSQVEKQVDVTSDEHIKALAEAIVNELNPKADGMQTNSTERKNEVFLVVIDVTDKDIPEDTVIQLSAEVQTHKQVTEAESFNTSFDDGCYGTRIKVRNLDVSNEVEKNVFKKKLGRSGKLRKSDTPTVGSKQVLENLDSIMGKNTTLDAEFERHFREKTQYHPSMNLAAENRPLKSAEDLSQGTEKRKEAFEGTIRRIRATRSHIPVGKKMQTMNLPKKKLSTVSTDSSHDAFAGSRPPRPIEYVNELRIQNKNASDLGKRDDVTPEIISKEATLIDDPPMRHSEYKILRKVRGEINEDDKFKKSSAIRSYHNSCKNLCKLTKGFGDGKPPIVVMNLDKKKGGNSKGDGDSPKEGNVKIEPMHLTNEYSSSKLDNTCDVLNKTPKLTDLNGSNNIYLQEESIIDNKAQRKEEKIVQKTNKIQPTKKEDDPNEERYELDIADARTSGSSMGVKVPYSAVYPSNRALTGDERKRFDIFRDIKSETFEMNVKCLNKDETIGEKPSECESPLSTNTETIATPKISDNIMNLANVGLTEQKGPPSVDSLSMMKRVKEMVDMDLQNAEKIFTAREVELNVEGQTEENTSASLPLSMTPVPPKSVIIRNEETNRFYINASELEHAENVQKQALALAWEQMKILDFNHEEYKGDFPISVDATEGKANVNAHYILKSGDSILVYDEEKRKWNVDFSLLRKKERAEERQHKEVLNDKSEVSPPESPTEKPQTESREDPSLSRMVPAEVLPIPGGTKSQAEIPDKQVGPAKKAIEIKPKAKEEPVKEIDSKEIRRKNSDLYDNVFIGINKPSAKTKEEVVVSDTSKGVNCKGVKGLKADNIENLPSEHYVSENIVEMSKNNTVKPRLNKVETVKLNITPKARPPSKVTEINLSKKSEEGKSSVKKDSERREDGTRKRDQPNGTFYKKFEKYKSPFSDLEYEDKPMKINSDLESNPNLKKLDSWSKTLVLQEISKSSENVDGWLREETDKMATLLLKVLQDAADGNSRRKGAGKISGKGRNPYEAIRKKQENNLSAVKGKKKEPVRKKVVVALQVKKPGGKDPGMMKAQEKNKEDERSKKGQFPLIEDDSHVEVLTPESHLPKELFLVPHAPITILNENINDDIPGPYLLKKISSLWRYLPDLGCQTTIFFLIRIFNLAKTGLSVFAFDTKKSRRNPFERLFMKYGPVVKLQGPLSGDVILINRPDDFSSVFTQAKTTPARSVLDSVENCRVRVRKKNFPLGITRSCNGIEWDVIRKSVIDVGNKGSLQYFNMVKNADAMFVDKIRCIRNNQNQVPDYFINEVKKWSMEGLCGVLFDKSLGFLEKKHSQIQWIAESERLMRHLGEATDYLCQCESSFQMWRFINTPAMRDLNQSYQALDLIISKYVYQAELTLRKKKKALTNNKSNSDKNLNFLESVLLNDRMAPDEITANLIDMLLIGVNTTTVALAFLLYNLAQNNRVQCLLFKEIKDLLPTKTSTLNYHQLHSLKYLQACLKESMRLNVPIALLLKVLPNDITLASYRVPLGTYVIMDTQAACMREQTFDDPERFKPERWLEQDCVHPFSSVPFSNGPRAGFIKRLTEIQLWTCVAQIVRNYQIEYHFGEIRSSKGVISYPDKPLRLTFIERLD